MAWCDLIWTEAPLIYWKDQRSLTMYVVAGSRSLDTIKAHWRSQYIPSPHRDNHFSKD
jgi:hypothetical protein